MWLLIYLSLPVLSPQVFNLLFLKQCLVPVLQSSPFFCFNLYGSCFYCFQKFSAIFLLLRNSCFFAALLVLPSIFLLCTVFCFSHFRLLSNFPAFLFSDSYLKTVLDSLHAVFCLPCPCISWFSSQLLKPVYKVLRYIRNRKCL